MRPNTSRASAALITLRDSLEHVRRSGQADGHLPARLAASDNLEKGWPEDVVEQIHTDRKEGVHRVSVLTINDAARYLGLSRSGVEKLITAGKLRLFTIAPTYRDEKPAKRIPAKDVVGLK